MVKRDGKMSNGIAFSGKASSSQSAKVSTQIVRRKPPTGANRVAGGECTHEPPVSIPRRNAPEGLVVLHKSELVLGDLGKFGRMPTPFGNAKL